VFVVDVSTLPHYAEKILEPRMSYRRGSLSTVDLLVLTSLVQLIYIMKTLFRCLTKQATLFRRSTVLSLPLKLVSPARANASLHYENLVRSKMAH